MIAPDRLYMKSHEWVKIEGDVATVGISDHAQEALGDITFVELPEVGDALTQGTDCAVIESVKAASDLYAPLSGSIVAINDALDSAPELVNDSPYDKGWIFKISGFDAAEVSNLLDANAYQALLESEA